MGRSNGRIVALTISATTLLASCTLINLSGLQGGAGAGAGGATSSTTASGVTSTSSTNGSSTTGSGTGGAGGSTGVIHKLYVAGGRVVGGQPFNTIFTTTIADDGELDPFDSVVQTLPDAREHAGLALVGSDMFLLGGRGLTGATLFDRASNYVSVLGPDGTLGAWSMTPAILPSGGYATFGTTSDSSHIFIAGGSNSAATFVSNSILRGDVVNDSIQTLDPIGTLPAATENDALVIADGLLFVLGGSASPKQVLFATLNGDGSIGTLMTGPSFNAGRDTSCAAVGSIGGSTRIYVAGGVGSPPLASIEVSTLTGGVLGAWQTSSVLLGAGRSGCKCFVLGDSLYVVGGVLSSDTGTDEVARVQLDPQSGQPSTVSLERPLPAPRGYEDALVVDLKAP